MSFVTCKQFKDSQDAQDKALDTAKTEQAKALNNAKEQIAQSAMKAEAALLDCADNANGVTTSPICPQNGKGGVISVAKIKQSIAGDVAVAVKPNSGITGNGTKNQPLELNVGNGLKLGDDGKVTINPTETAAAIGSQDAGKAFLQALKNNGLLGDGLDVVNGKLIVKTVRSVDASGTVLLGHYVDKE
ncbi:hypothetical protein [Haemophilus parahaemolyticus]|uniref:hypothetical protein n=1 Tax=Haemophilus parahaemolyticus TaxID=735 RepID=UPI0028E4D98A|nr:hypothetical protein [Haemophilus parahaemolyticus]